MTQQFLLDTHLLLWWLLDAKRLSKAARDILLDLNAVVFVSTASIWEIAIKSSLGKLKIPPDFLAVLDEQAFPELVIRREHAWAIAELPNIHRDPFDRMLIAQASIEKLTIITSDKDILQYDVATIEV